MATANISLPSGLWMSSCLRYQSQIDGNYTSEVTITEDSNKILSAKINLLDVYHSIKLCLQLIEYDNPNTNIEDIPYTSTLRINTILDIVNKACFARKYILLYPRYFRKDDLDILDNILKVLVPQTREVYDFDHNKGEVKKTVPWEVGKLRYINCYIYSKNVMLSNLKDLDHIETTQVWS